MFTFNKDFTGVQAASGQVFDMEDNADFLYFFLQDGSMRYVGIDQPESIEALKHEKTVIDVDGGAIMEHSCGNAGLSIKHYKDMCGQEGEEETINVPYPFAIHRKKGAYALAIYKA